MIYRGFYFVILLGLSVEHKGEKMAHILWLWNLDVMLCPHGLVIVCPHAAIQTLLVIGFPRLIDLLQVSMDSSPNFTVV